MEIDRDAIAASLSNARLNGLVGRFRCFLPSDRTEDAGRVQDLRYAAMLRRGAAADPPMAEFRALPEIESAFDVVVANILAGILPPPPTPRTKWTRRVPLPVLIGHAASLSSQGPSCASRRRSRPSHAPARRSASRGSSRRRRGPPAPRAPRSWGQGW